MDKKQRVKKALCVFLSVASVSSMVTPVSFAAPTGLWLESTLYRNEAVATTGRFKNLGAVAVYLAKTKKEPTVAVYLKFADRKYTRLLLFDAPVGKAVTQGEVVGWCKKEIEEFKMAGYGKYGVLCPVEPVPGTSDGSLLVVELVFEKDTTAASSQSAPAGPSPSQSSSSTSDDAPPWTALEPFACAPPTFIP